MIIPSWLMDVNAGFFVNMDKVARIEVLKDETIRGQERITKYYVKFTFDNNSEYIPPIYYETMEDATESIEKLVIGLSDHAKTLMADSIGNGMFKRDIMLNNAIVKAKAKMTETDKNNTPTINQEETQGTITKE